MAKAPSPLPPPAAALTKVVPGGRGGPPKPAGRFFSDAPKPSRLAFDFGLGAGRRSVAGVRSVDGPSPPPTVADDDEPAAALKPLSGNRWVPTRSGRRTPSNSNGLWLRRTRPTAWGAGEVASSQR